MSSHIHNCLILPTADVLYLQLSCCIYNCLVLSTIDVPWLKLQSAHISQPLLMAVQILQSHMILTMSHWSSGLPVCFPPQGLQVQIPWGVLTVCETGILLLALSRYMDNIFCPQLIFHSAAVFLCIFCGLILSIAVFFVARLFPQLTHITQSRHYVFLSVTHCPHLCLNTCTNCHVNA